ncbi:MAG TPA: hypothetical protein VJQ44_00725, partial [Gemmatimonadales bacterium]|nr:hypothetical protein [Gemmatimonadales bacterium]
MRTSAWISLLGLVGLAVACGDQPTEVLPEKELAQGPGMIALATASSDDGLSITTDQNDYAPGDTVWFTGAGWPAEDTLDILLTDDTGDEHRWSIATAEDGTFRDSTYVVNDGDLNVTFTLSATSRSTGRYLTVTFTDANPSVSAITLSPTRPDPSASPFTASFTVSINGSVTSPWRSTGWRIYPKGSASGAYTCVNTADRTTVGTSALTVLTLSTPSIVGEYTLDVQTYSDDGTACATRVGSGETLDFFVGTPDLTISKTHTGSFAASGTGSYLITVTNSGNLVSNGPISVTDALPSGFTFSSA